MELDLDVPFPSARHAQIAHDALSVDKEPKRSGMRKTLEVREEKLHVEFRCDEPRVMRVSVNAFLDLLALVTDTMDQFDE